MYRLALGDLFHNQEGRQKCYKLPYSGLAESRPLINLSEPKILTSNRKEKTMTCHIENNQFDLAKELLIENGFNGIADAVSDH